MTQSEWLYLTASAALIAFLLYRNLPGAILFLAPKLTRIRVEGGPGEVTAAGHGSAIATMLEDVKALGFSPLGVKWEKKPLGMTQKELVLASEAEHAFAGVMPVTNEAWLYFFTPLEGGGAVITADFKWPAADDADYLAGGLPMGTPTEVLNAHRRRVKSLEAKGLRPAAGFTLADRERSARAFYESGPGRRETRRRELARVVFAGAAVLWIGFLVRAVLHKYGRV